MVELYAEQDVVNNVLNNLQNNFTFKKGFRVQVWPGAQLTSRIFQVALNDSLNTINDQFHVPVNIKKYGILNKDTIYILVYDHDKSGQMRLRLVFPYGANLMNILAAAVIEDSRDRLSKSDIQKILHKNMIKCADDIAIHQVFKTYLPQDQTIKQMPKSIIDSIRYKGLSNDTFNMVIKYNLNINDIYEPLKRVIKDNSKKHNKHDYENVALVPIQMLTYNEDKHLVQFITSLY